MPEREIAGLGPAELGLNPFFAAATGRPGYQRGDVLRVRSRRAFAAHVVSWSGYASGAASPRRAKSRMIATIESRHVPIMCRETPNPQRYFSSQGCHVAK